MGVDVMGSRRSGTTPSDEHLQDQRSSGFYSTADVVTSLLEMFMKYLILCIP